MTLFRPEAIDSHLLSEDLLEACLSRIDDGLVVVGANRAAGTEPHILFVNEAFLRRTGYRRDEVLGRAAFFSAAPETDPAELARLRSAMRCGEAARGELLGCTRFGETYWVDVAVTPIADAADGSARWVGVTRDISQRKRAEQRMYRLAFYDGLTGLPNRCLLKNSLASAIAECDESGHCGALIGIGLDRFRQVNDTHGQSCGDLLLELTARRLEACLSGRGLVARTGGDEFTVLLSGLGSDVEAASAKAQSWAERLRSALAEPHELAASPHAGSASIGLAVFSATDQAIDEVMKRADLALHRAKLAGRNTVRCFEPAMQAELHATLWLEAELRQATLHFDQFRLVYQTIVDADRRVSGVEALLRWQHPVRGAVGPAEFIPLAEQNGLIVPIGQWVLRQACERLALWGRSEATASLNLSINVSAVQFRQPAFVAEVLQALDEAGADPHRLVIELTESLMLQDVEGAIARMQALRARGVSFTLDDFGTGYSSLSYLKRLPLSGLKMDQSFVRDLLHDEHDAAIARTILALAHSLGLMVVAEGVETEGQRQFLVDLGCKAFQGYLFSRPADAALVEAGLPRRLALPPCNCRTDPAAAAAANTHPAPTMKTLEESRRDELAAVASQLRMLMTQHLARPEPVPPNLNGMLDTLALQNSLMALAAACRQSQAARAAVPNAEASGECLRELMLSIGRTRD